MPKAIPVFVVIAVSSVACSIGEPGAPEVPEICVPCAGGEVCNEDFECVESDQSTQEAGVELDECDASTCDGCCYENFCVEDCGKGRECNEEALQCEFIEGAQWGIVVRDAEVPATTYEGGEWDTHGSLPDPYVHMSSAAWNKNQRTMVESNTLNPLFNTAVVATVELDRILAPIEISIRDSDRNDPDIIGSCLYQLTEEQLIERPLITLECPGTAATNSPGYVLRFYPIFYDTPYGELPY